MDRLHWQRLRDNAGDSDSHYLLALATLGHSDKNRNNPICVMSPKVAKASTICIAVAIACVIALTFANGNTG
jgi:hypothetical protein